MKAGCFNGKSFMVETVTCVCSKAELSITWASSVWPAALSTAAQYDTLELNVTGVCGETPRLLRHPSRMEERLEMGHLIHMVFEQT